MKQLSQTRQFAKDVKRMGKCREDTVKTVMHRGSAVSEKIMKKVKHDEWLREQLKDPGFSAEYLTAAAEDEEPAVFLQALRKVAETQGMAKVAKRAGIPRESLYRMLSAKGNPRWSTLAPVVRAAGLKLEIIQP